MGFNARVIGITGSIGAGKSLVASLFKQRGYIVLNLDSLAHECLLEQQAVVVSFFGKDILDDSGQINRHALGKLVFSSPRLLAKLELIIYPSLKTKVLEHLEKEKNGKFVLDGALLYKIGLYPYCEIVLVIKSCLLKRLYRLYTKRGLPLNYVLKIIKRQRKLVPKSTKNVIIVNNGSIDSLIRFLEKLKLF